MRRSEPQPFSSRILAVGFVALFGLATCPGHADEPPSAPAEAEVVLDHVERLRPTWRSRRSAEPRLDETEHRALSAHLDTLDRTLEGFDAEVASPLRVELRRLRTELRTWHEGVAPPRATKTPVELPPVRAPIVALDASDGCADAPLVGVGSYTGVTTTASNDGSALCGGSFVAPDVWVRYRAPAAGNVFFDLLGSDYDAVLSLHEGCPGTHDNQTACASHDDRDGPALRRFLDAGEEVLVRISGTTAGRERGAFALHIGGGGAIAGAVRDRGTGSPIAGIGVELVDDEGRHQGSVSTDASGRYSFDGLATGDYFVAVRDGSVYRPEVWPNAPCPTGIRCDIDAVGDPVAVTADALTDDIDFALSVGGRVEGTVRGTSGEPLSSLRVELYGIDGVRLSTTHTGMDGRYRFVGLDGVYHLLIERGRAVDFLFGDIPCTPGLCDPTQSAPLVAGLGDLAIADFRVPALASIEGTVREANTGAAVAFGRVVIGPFLDSISTDSQGRYRLDDLPPGEHRLFARGETFDHLGALYPNTPCLRGACRTEDAAPVALAFDQRATIDFTLSRGARLRGVVTAASTGQPTGEPIRVRVWCDDGEWMGDSTVEADGTWESRALLAGSYTAAALGLVDSRFAAEMYGGPPCRRAPRDLFEECDPASGARLTVAHEQVRGGLAFALDERGTMRTRVTDAASGQPVGGATVRLYGESGWQLDLPVGSDGDDPLQTAADGSALIDRLPTGDYRLVVEKDGYVKQLWAGISCHHFCPLSDADLLAVVPAAETAVSMVLEPAGRISGRITDHQGAAIAGMIVTATDEAGNTTPTDRTDANGDYRLDRLVPGTYWVFGRSFTLPYRAEVYPDQPCDSSCGTDELSGGTPITVTSGQEATGIDFDLDRWPELTGSVVDPAGQVLHSAEVGLWNGAGALLDDATTFTAGTFRFTGLRPGRHYVSASRFGALGLVYDGVPCPGIACDVTTGTAVDLSLNEVRDIGFVLREGGAIEGQVRDVNGVPVDRAPITVWDGANRLVARGTSDAVGRYRVPGLATEDYFVVARGGEALISQVWPNRPCPEGSCGVIGGTPVSVVDGQTTNGIDFALPRRATLSGQVIVDLDGTPIQSAAARAFTADGTEIELDFTDAEGRFELSPDFLGVIYLRFSAGGFESQLYEGVACDGDCDPSDGTPITLASGSVLEGLDGRLRRAACVPDDINLCLADGRFRVSARYRAGNVLGLGRAAPLTDDAGTFWFFRPDNVEIVIKMVDGCPTFDRFWVFAAGLTDVNVEIFVTDTATGELRRYINPAGTPFQPVQDTQAFATCDAVYPFVTTDPDTASATLPKAALESTAEEPDGSDVELRGTCVPDANVLCLGNARFAVYADWRLADNTGGQAAAVTLTPDTGYFWFFRPDNLEVIVKVLDACSGFDRFWVFAAGLTNVEVDLEVFDTLSGEVRRYTNAQGDRFPPIQDTQAFATCP